MDSELDSIAFRDINVTEMSLIRLSLKSVSGRLFIDVRKWVKWPNMDKFSATRKGIMIEAKEWKGIMADIASFMAENRVDIAA